MELVNQTALAARLDIGRTNGAGRRCGLLVAKATFRIDDDGSTPLETQDPHPLFGAGETSALGDLPRDDLPRNDHAFEVALLGSAYAPTGSPVGRRRVGLSVGAARQEIVVIGDREWISSGDDARISEPEPFTRMALTWARAFGGRTDVDVDVDSPVEIEHATNPLGVGFDPAGQARELDAFLSCPPGFPRFARARRLPNLERPDALIDHWSDAPKPACFAPVPPGSALHLERLITADHIAAGKVDESVGRAIKAAELLQAHPDWVLERAPEAGAPVVIDGMSPMGRIAFAFPKLTVHLDYVLGARTGTKQLRAHALLLLPEEMRFTVVYRLPFEVDAPNGEERGARLRIEGANGGKA